MIKNTSIYNYVRWCIRLRALLPWCVHLVSTRELTREEYEYPSLLDDLLSGVTEDNVHGEFIINPVPPEVCGWCGGKQVGCFKCGGPC